MKFIEETDNQPNPRAGCPEVQAQSEAASCLASAEARLHEFGTCPIVSIRVLRGPRIKRAQGPSARPYKVEPCHQGPIMEEREIQEAIQRAQHGIAQYLEITELFPAVNVAENRDFQRKFNAFYRVMKKSAGWYRAYYEFMERRKYSKPTFEETLDHLWSAFDRCEASFSSKLVATIDPQQPIWDSIVLGNVGIARPKYGRTDRLSDAKTVYRSLCDWYAQYLSSDTARLIISLFNQNLKECTRITDVKKVDFVLWQMRAKQAKHIAQTSGV
jgi:hypothetical protein